MDFIKHTFESLQNIARVKKQWFLFSKYYDQSIAQGSDGPCRCALKSWLSNTYRWIPLSTDFKILQNIARVKHNSDIYISQLLGPRYFKGK